MFHSEPQFHMQRWISLSSGKGACAAVSKVQLNLQTKEQDNQIEILKATYMP